MSKLRFLAGSLELEDKPIHSIIAEELQKLFAHVDGYLAYKLTSLGRNDDSEAPSFMLISKEYGITCLDVVEGTLESIHYRGEDEIWTVSGQEMYSRDYLMDLFTDEIKSRLKNDSSLYSRKKKDIIFPIKSIVILNANTNADIKSKEPEDGFYSYCFGHDNLSDNILKSINDNQDEALSDEKLDLVISLIEGTYIFQDKFKVNTEQELKTINSYIKKSQERTFKQDEAQRIISLQLPNGYQRIRGLAGTGKTIVLSLKAAITHKRKPDFKILYLFNTQSLYEIVTNLISKYYLSEAKKIPDFDNKLNIYHAWGGRNKAGLYSEICKKLGVTPKTYGNVKGISDPLEYIYRDLLDNHSDRIEPFYDMVLIDEAQDLSPALFEMVYKLTKSPKRIVWAYDEFQSLKADKMKSVEELFGKDSAGEPNISEDMLNGTYLGGIEKDFILPHCYRTPRPLLMVAHGVALGLYNKTRRMQLFDNKKDWNAIGYELLSPKDADEIQEYDEVELFRPESNRSNGLEKILNENGKNPLELVRVNTLNSFEEEMQFISTQIEYLINKQNVSPENIIVIDINYSNGCKDECLQLRQLLNQKGIKSVTPGFVESVDVFKVKNHITIATPFKAKGNESDVVFLMNSQKVSSDITLRARNAFFASVTRSRGWCYITGHGQFMEVLEKEINSITADFPYFKFTRPSNEKVNNVRELLSKSDKEIERAERDIQSALSNPELLLETLKNNPEFMKMFNDNEG
ncbi:ATP-binding domain-containing protein [uncultured Shewanella sp.]|uniref:DEAD/DEAH box helicase n=1 Tax=uncultured Shewanella sp. TaxID=173975 RepID=UPI00262D9039|nr:ATP-binding domain-containing protein [uncultured Shewanella sp.]